MGDLLQERDNAPSFDNSIILEEDEDRGPKSEEFRTPSPLKNYDEQDTPEISWNETPPHIRNLSNTDKVRSILLRDQRSDNEAIFLYKNLKSVQFFNYFKEKNPTLRVKDALINLCKLAKFEAHPQDKVLYKKGDDCDQKIYLILSGHVRELSEKTLAEKRKDEESGASSHPFERKPSSTPDLDNLFNQVKLASKAANSLNDLDSNLGKMKEKILKRWEYFGHSCLKEDAAKRTQTVITKTPCEFLCLTSRDYEYLQARYSKTNTERLNFLLDYVPELDRALRLGYVQNAEKLFTEETLDIHNTITEEGDRGKKLFLLYDGTCEVYKNDENNPKAKILLCIVQPGVFIGEEILYSKDRCYKYTVKVRSSKATVLSITPGNFYYKLPQQIFLELKKLYLSKHEKHINLHREKAEQQKRIILPTLPHRSSSKEYSPPSNPPPNKLLTGLASLRRSATIKHIPPKSPVTTADKENIKNVVMKKYSRITFLPPDSLSKEIFRSNSPPLNPISSNTKEWEPKCPRAHPTKDPTQLDKFKFVFGRDYEDEYAEVLERIRDKDKPVRPSAKKIDDFMFSQKRLDTMANYLLETRRDQLRITQTYRNSKSNSPDSSVDGGVFVTALGKDPNNSSVNQSTLTMKPSLPSKLGFFPGMLPIDADNSGLGGNNTSRLKIINDSGIEKKKFFDNTTVLTRNIPKAHADKLDKLLKKIKENL